MNRHCPCCGTPLTAPVLPSQRIGAVGFCDDVCKRTYVARNEWKASA